MKKSIFLFFAAILCSLSAGAATERVYFVNASNWSKINVYAWDGTATGTSWPGNTATKDTWQWEGKDVYYFEAEAGAYKKCIFNNGNGQQTADLPWTANQVYDHNSQSWLPVEVAQATTTGTTVYFVNTENWNPVNVYAFSKYPSEINNNSWPGVAATKESYQIGGFDVYSYKITKEFDYCIFNNGSQQSADLPWYQGKYYAPSKNTWYDDKAAAEEALAVPVDDVTVYFINTAGWDEVACHHWLEGVSGTTWPGDVMTKETEQIAGYDVYTLTFTGEHPKCIFNNNKESGASQTGNLDVQDGKYYALSTQTWYDTKADAENALATPLPDETVYFVNNKSWTKVQVYGFEGSKGNADPAWPGTDITTNKTGEKVGEYDVYSFTAKQGEYAKIIFNNKEGDTGEQTNNLVWTNGKYYYMEAPTDYEGGTADEVKTAIDNLVTYDYYIADNGSLSGNADWSSKAIGLTDDNSDGVYEKTFTAQAAGTYLLKVTNGTWNDGYVWGFSAVEGAYEEVNAGESDNNIEITLTTATTFTVKFDSDTKEITFDGLTEKTVVKYDYYLIGTINGWATKDENFGMTDENADGVYEKEVTLAAGDNELKVNNGTWDDGCHWGFGNLSAKYEGVEEGKDGEGKPNGNIKITLATQQTITVKFDKNTSKITLDGLTESTAPTKYYVKGSHNAWTADATSEMTLDGEVYKKEVTLAKDVEFKINDGASAWWGVNNLGGKVYKELEKGSDDNIKMKEEKTFTIIFNPAENLITFENLTEETPVVEDFSNQPSTLYFRPSTNWKEADARFAAYFFGTEAKWLDMTDSDSDGIYEVANDKTNANVIFCRMNPATTENDWGNKWTQTDDIVIPNEADNLNTVWVPWQNYNYDQQASGIWVAPTPLTDTNWSDFVTAYKGKTINAVVERSFVYEQLHTLCLPFNVELHWLGEEAKAYKLNSVVGNSAQELSLNASECATMTAGQPYIVKPKKGSEYEYLIVADAAVQNVSAGSYTITGGGYKVTMQGIAATPNPAQQTDGSTEYWLAMEDGCLYKTPTNKLGLRSIIKMTTTSGAPINVRARVAFNENVETGVEDIITTDTPVKVIENGQLIIIRDGVKYNVQGQKL